MNVARRENKYVSLSLWLWLSRWFLFNNWKLSLRAAVWRLSRFGNVFPNHPGSRSLKCSHTKKKQKQTKKKTPLDWVETPVNNQPGNDQPYFRLIQIDFLALFLSLPSSSTWSLIINGHMILNMSYSWWSIQFRKIHCIVSKIVISNDRPASRRMKHERKIAFIIFQLVYFIYSSYFFFLIF